MSSTSNHINHSLQGPLRQDAYDAAIDWRNARVNNRDTHIDLENNTVNGLLVSEWDVQEETKHLRGIVGHEANKRIFFAVAAICLLAGLILGRDALKNQSLSELPQNSIFLACGSLFSGSLALYSTLEGRRRRQEFARHVVFKCEKHSKNNIQLDGWMAKNELNLFGRVINIVKSKNKLVGVN